MPNGRAAGLPSRPGRARTSGRSASRSMPAAWPPPRRREVALAHRSPLSIGALAGHWCAYGFAPDLPADQRAEDGKSLLFDSAPLGAAVEILGAPVVTLELAADQPQAQVCVRLNDVAPDGASLRVSYGLLNLTHRDSHESPAPLEPGKRYRVRVQLNDIAHVFPAGHRIRVAVSTSYWPIAWPSPAPVTLTLYAGAEHARTARAPAAGRGCHAGAVPAGGSVASAADDRASARQDQRARDLRSHQRDHDLHDRRRPRPLHHRRHRLHQRSHEEGDLPHRARTTRPRR